MTTSFEACRSLWGAVLRQAVQDLLAESDDALRVNLRRIYSERARRWFRAEERGVGGFLWVCEVLGLDPDYIRDKVRWLMEAGERAQGGDRHHPDLASAMRGFRFRHGLTQADLAEKVGCAPGNIGRIEGGWSPASCHFERIREVIGYGCDGGG